MSSKEPYDSPILQEFSAMKDENLFPIWPPDRPIEPLYHLPPVESRYLLPEAPEEWSACIVVEKFDADLYIYCDGVWWLLPKITSRVAQCLTEFAQMTDYDLESIPTWPSNRAIENRNTVEPIRYLKNLPAAEDWDMALYIPEDGRTTWMLLYYEGQWWKMLLSSDDAYLKVSQLAEGLYEALTNIIEIGKRDMTNPKYDSYFASAKVALEQYESKFKK